MQNHPSLEYFIVIADESNITHAARRLNITQQSLTAYLGRLEKFYGATLFNRGFRRLTLTPFGQQVYDTALQIRSLQNQLYNRRPQVQKPESRLIRIGCVRPHATQILKKVPIRQSVISNPELTFSFAEESNSVLKQMLLEGELDIILCYQHPELSSQEFCEVDLYEAGVYLMVSDTLLAGAFPGLLPDTLSSWKTNGIDLKQFRHMPMVLPPLHSYVRKTVNSYMEQHNARFDKITECDNYSMAEYLTISNVGASLTSPTDIQQLSDTADEPEMQYLPVRSPNISRRMTMYYRRAAAADYVFEEFVRNIKRALTD